MLPGATFYVVSEGEGVEVSLKKGGRYKSSPLDGSAVGG
jgi:hypothetical protein